VVDLTDTTLDSVIGADRPVFVALWASWCVPCRVQQPILETLARHFGSRVVFARLNVDENPQVCARLAVNAIPLVLLFRKGSEPARIVGVQTETALARLIYRFIE
jgi:thioredoxin 1